MIFTKPAIMMIFTGAATKPQPTMAKSKTEVPKKEEVEETKEKPSNE